MVTVVAYNEVRKGWAFHPWSLVTYNEVRKGWAFHPWSLWWLTMR